MEESAQISATALREQVAKILQQSVFQKSRILTNFLRFITEHSLDPQANPLKEYTIGVEVLGKKAGYNTHTDASVRIHAVRLRRALAEYYAGPGQSDPILITVPKGSYVPMMEPYPFAVAETTHFNDRPTLAVLPFLVADDGYLSRMVDGICDQISTEFNGFGDLAVIAYASSRQIASREPDLRKVTALLGAQYVLTGSLDALDNQIRIRVQLVEAASLLQLWACSYERDKNALNVFEIQDDISRHVVNRIAGTYGIIFRNEAKIKPGMKLLDLQVYDAIFWYYHLNNAYNPEVYHKALASMRKAVALDDQYAMGWAILAETYVAGFFYGFDTGIPDPLSEATRCAAKALQIDQFCQHAYQASALAALFRHDPEAGRKSVDAWKRVPMHSAGVAGGMGFCLICMGEYEEGIALMEESIELNPYFPWWFNAGFSLYHFHHAEYHVAAHWAEKMFSNEESWSLILQLASLDALGATTEAGTRADALRLRIPDPQTQYTMMGAFIQDEQLCNRLRTAVLKYFR